MVIKAHMLMMIIVMVLIFLDYQHHHQANNLCELGIERETLVELCKNFKQIPQVSFLVMVIVMVSYLVMVMVARVVIVLALLTVRRELISKRFKFETVLMGYFLSIVISSS